MTREQNTKYWHRRRARQAERMPKVREILAALPQLRTQSEVARIIGISNTRIRAIEREILWKIYKRCNEAVIET